MPKFKYSIFKTFSFWISVCLWVLSFIATGYKGDYFFTSSLGFFILSYVEVILAYVRHLAGDKGWE